MPLPPAGELRISDVTHSSMKLNWDAAPGAVTKYTVTYQPEDGEPKEVEHLDGPTSPVPRRRTEWTWLVVQRRSRGGVEEVKGSQS